MEATTLLTLPLILFLFLFLSFTTNGVSARHGISIVDQPPAVLDSKGNKIVKGEYYYLQPVLHLPHVYKAAIIPGLFREETCWLQLQAEVFTYGITGIPVKFSPVEPHEGGFISESPNLNVIKFSHKLSPLCGGSVLKVGALGDEFLSLDGLEEDGSSWFKIERASELSDHVYKLVSSSAGGDVGASTRYDGTLRLVLTDGNPISFQFVAVKDMPSATK